MSSYPPTAEIEQALAAALSALRAGNFCEVEQICRRVRAVAPGNGAAWQVWGLAALQAGRVDAAAELFGRAVEASPGDARVRARYAEALRMIGRNGEALAQYREAVRLSPEDADLYFAMGNGLRDAGELEGAVEAFRRAIVIRPDHLGAWFNLANERFRRGAHREAKKSYERVVALQPEHGAAWAGIGHCCDVDEADRAEWAYRRAMALPAADPKLPGHLGTLLMQSGRVEEAIDAYRKVVGLPGGDEGVWRNLLTALTYGGRATPEEIFEEHRRWGRALEARVPCTTGHANDRDPERRLRVGYVSGDFREHAVWKWLEPIFEHHDRTRFEIACYHTSRADDASTAKAKAFAAVWRDVAGMSDDDLARQIVADGIDLLVDLAGHTPDGRLEVFARKPAPVQVTYLGYPNTTGLSRIDYKLTDGYIDPAGQSERYHTERLFRLPHCFSCYHPPASAPEVTALPARERGFVRFGSFNRVEKISEGVLALWARVLQDVEGSRLLIKSSSLKVCGTKERLLDKFESLGVGGRIDLAGVVASEAEHLATYGQADVALDTFPFNGTTTTCDALWMGVPVVTLAGPTHRSRVSASFLHELRYEEWIAGSEDDYVRIAARLAEDLDALASVRAGLRGKMAGSQLTDGARFTREYEGALREMWKGYCRAGGGAGEGRGGGDGRDAY